MTALPADIYRPEQWHDFFIMVGGGSAALTGLVFVAMTLNLGAIFRDPTHTGRAAGTLAGFVSIFVVCALALMGGQNHLALGLEWLAVSGTAAYVYFRGYFMARRRGRSAIGLGRRRIITGTTYYAAEILGTILLMLGHVAGLYLAAAGMALYVPYLISGAWLLLVGVHNDQAQKP